MSSKHNASRRNKNKTTLTAVSTPAYKKRVVIAIDFGSTHCGIAYSLVNLLGVPDEEDPDFDYSTILEKPEILAKIYKGKHEKEPTCALFNRDTNKLTDFGFQAVDTYLEMIADDAQSYLDDHLYFEGRDIKMRLWEQLGSAHNVEVPTHDGRHRMKLMDVVSGILGHLKTESLKLASKGLDVDEEILNSIEAEGDGLFRAKGIQPEETLWVLTVPSIWKEADKQFMRKAAHEAGMITSPESPDLVLALEPECAIIAACQSLGGFQQGDKILTLDCGGGTVDICAVEVLESYSQTKSNKGRRSKMRRANSKSNLRLRHLIEPCGGNWGSTYIDRKFQDFLEFFLKDHLLEKLKKYDPGAVLEIFKEFEGIKTSITYDDYSESGKSYSINFANVLYAINQDHKINENWGEFYGNKSIEPGQVPKKITLKDILDEYTARCMIAEEAAEFNEDIDISYIHGLSITGMKGDETNLVLPMPLLRSFFSSVIEYIVNEVEDLCAKSQLAGLKYVLLVGGFADSGVLKKEIKRKLRNVDRKIKLLIPKHPSTVVQKGAVQYGFDPNIISTRRARQTIGIKVTMRMKDLEKAQKAWRVLLDDPDLKDHVHSEKSGDVVRDIFNVYICKGQEISTTELVTSTFRSPGKGNKVKFDIYATDNTDPKYVTDKDCTRLATIHIPVEEGKNTSLECKMSFASTEIIAKVKNMKTNETKEHLLVYNTLLDDDDDDGVNNNSLIVVKNRKIGTWWRSPFDLAKIDERESMKKQESAGESVML